MKPVRYGPALDQKHAKSGIVTPGWLADKGGAEWNRT